LHAEPQLFCQLLVFDAKLETDVQVFHMIYDFATLLELLLA